MGEFIKSNRGGFLLTHKGFLYHKTNRKNNTWYWVCAKKPECNTRAVSTGEPPDHPRVTKAGQHDHPPDLEEVAAKKLVNKMKKKATEHPEMPPANIIRSALSRTGNEVLPRLPERPALKRALNRTRQAELPQNPQTLSEIKELPDQYRRTISGEEFLLYDSRDDESSDSDSDSDEDVDERPRAVVFATRSNLRLLGKSNKWFLDGTFSVAPSLFLQLFTIHGLFKDHAVPLVYALLTSKAQDLYTLVLQKLLEKCTAFNINLREPVTMICDFELAIINSCKETFGNAQMRLCFFHLGQSVYRKVQAAGLQTAYADPHDREIKSGTHMLLSLAFVPSQDVQEAFDMLRGNLPQELIGIADDFEATYIRTRRARTRRPGPSRPPRYPVSEWNQYEAARLMGPRTNNLTEGWHNRFNSMVGKKHPSFYHLLREIQKEQRDTEVMVTELTLGRKVRVPQLKKYQRVDQQLQTLVLDYPTYKDDGRVMDYLRNCGHVVAF